MNSSLKCLVVEDESLAAEIIADYIAEVPFLQLDRILGNAIAAMENRLQSAQNGAPGTVQKEEDIILAVNKEKIRLRKKDILYIEGMREYVAVHTISERIVVKNSLKNMLAMLGSEFLQIHKSYLVAKSRITTLSASALTLEGSKLPIGRQYRLQVHQALRSWQ